MVRSYAQTRILGGIWKVTFLNISWPYSCTWTIYDDIAWNELKSRPSFSAWGPKPRDATAARKNNHPIRAVGAAAAIRAAHCRGELKPRTKSMIVLLTAGKFPNSTDFLTSKLEPIFSWRCHYEILGPFHHASAGWVIFFLFCLYTSRSLGSDDIWKWLRILLICNVLQ